MDNKTLTHWGIKGMKWGERRYQNKDGSLTPAGKKRYDRDQRERSDDNKNKDPDPNKWVKEDLSRSRKLVDETSGMASKLAKVTNAQPKQTKLNLDNMTDQQLRNEINRAVLERQYNDMFAPKKVSRGRQYTTSILNGGVAALGITSSALGIALAIKELRG